MVGMGQDFEVYQKATEIINIVVTDADGNPVDLTTMDSICWILSMGLTEIVRYTLGDPELTIETTDDANDTMQIVLPHTVTRALREGKLYRHQGWVTIAGKPNPVGVGEVTVLRGDGCS
jgi:hypothetical protein